MLHRKDKENAQHSTSLRAVVLYEPEANAQCRSQRAEVKAGSPIEHPGLASDIALITWRERSGSSSKRGHVCRSARTFGLGNREPRFAQPIEYRIHQAAREVPGPDVRARMRRKLGIERQQIPDRGLRFSAAAEVPAGRCHDEEWPKESGDVHPVCALEGLLVLALVEVIPKGSEMHPARVVGIQFHRAAHNCGAALELSGVHDLQSQDPERVSVQRIEGYRALGRRTKGR